MVMVLIFVFVVMVVLLIVLMMMVFLVVMVVVITLIMFVLLITMMILNLVNPCCRSSHTVEVEHACIQDLLERHIAIVCLNDLCLWLNGSYDLAYAAKLRGTHLCGFVQQDDVAELYLLNHQVLDVLLLDVVAHQQVTAAKLVLHAKGIDDSHDAIDDRHSVVDILKSHRRH